MTDALNFELHTRNSFMTDAQISQSGPLFPKISLLDAKCFDFARRANFDDEAEVLHVESAHILRPHICRHVQARKCSVMQSNSRGVPL